MKNWHHLWKDMTVRLIMIATSLLNTAIKNSTVEVMNLSMSMRSDNVEDFHMKMSRHRLKKGVPFNA